MWITVEVFGFTLFTFGVGPRRTPTRERWISNTDGNFELAPDPVEEYEEYEEEYRLGFH